MTKPKHTQGTWKVISKIDQIGHAIMRDDTLIAKVELSNNANLIAAAPELYDLLEKINTAFYTRTSRKEWLALMEQTKPLLRKARGEL